MPRKGQTQSAEARAQISETKKRQAAEARAMLANYRAIIQPTDNTKLFEAIEHAQQAIDVAISQLKSQRTQLQNDYMAVEMPKEPDNDFPAPWSAYYKTAIRFLNSRVSLLEDKERNQ